MRRGQLVFRLTRLCIALAMASCASDPVSAPSDNDAAPDIAAQQQTLVDRFCAEAVKACQTVTLMQCVSIVADANKEAQTADLACATAATSCDQTSQCLDAMQANGGSTSQPSR